MKNVFAFIVLIMSFSNYASEFYGTVECLDKEGEILFRANTRLLDSKGGTASGYEYAKVGVILPKKKFAEYTVTNISESDDIYNVSFTANNKPFDPSSIYLATFSLSYPSVDIYKATFEDSILFGSSYRNLELGIDALDGELSSVKEIKCDSFNISRKK